jgi:hypothetical protein
VPVARGRDGHRRREQLRDERRLRLSHLSATEATVRAELAALRKEELP